MAYVKLDTGLLDSTLWVDRDGREVFITALLMALPHEVTEPAETFEVRSNEPTGFVVPVGWYGKVSAAGAGIVRRAGMEAEAGLSALERLAAPDPESRTPDFDGRRLVRVDGGYIVLNFMRYRDRDTTGAERQQRYRERHKGKKSDAVTVTGDTVTGRHVTQAVSSKQEAVGSKQEVSTTSTADRVRALLPELARQTFDDVAADNPDAVARALQSAHEPLTGGPSYSWPAIGQALIDYRARRKGEFVPVSFKRFLETNARPPLEDAPRPRKTNHDDTDAAIAEGVRRLNAAGVNHG